jgi:uncharacterized SAM-binding protein YcdF (DUF218 family)
MSAKPWAFFHFSADVRALHIRSSMFRFVRRAVGAALIAIFLLAIGWFFRAPLLTWIAERWIITDPLSPADAIVVLGGGLQTRPFEAARLYRAGYAPRILVASPERKPTEKLGITPGDTETARQILLAEGVPAEAIVPFGIEVSSTFEEALALRDWVAKAEARKIIIVTDPFHTRRVRWLFRKELATTKTEVLTAAAPPLKYQPSNWWQTEQGLIEFHNELFKYAFYRWKYSNDP